MVKRIIVAGIGGEFGSESQKARAGEISEADSRDSITDPMPIHRQIDGESGARIPIPMGMRRKTAFGSSPTSKKLDQKTAEFWDFLTMAKQNCKKPLTESRVPPRWTSPTRRWRLPPPTATVANIERQPVPPVKTGGTKAVPHYIVERLFDIVGF